MTLREMIEQRSKKLKRFKELNEIDQGEERELTTEEEAELDQLTDDIEQLDTDIDAAQEAEQDERSERRNNLLTRNRQVRQAPGRSTPTPRGPESRNVDLLDDHERMADYSLLRAIRCREEGRALDGFEAEVSQEIARRNGRAPKGFFAPSNLMVQRAALPAHLQTRDLTTTTGAGAVQKTVAQSMIEILRNRMLLMRLGATVIDDIVGDLDLPKQTGTGQAYWISEGNAPTKSNQTIGQVPLRRKSVGAYTEYTRAFTQQTSVSAENFVRNDLAQILALAIDLAGFAGTGLNSQPEGILTNSSVNVVTIGDNGGALTWPKTVNFRTQINIDNADVENMAFVTTPSVAEQLQTTVKFANTGMTIWTENDTVNGHRAMMTNQIPKAYTKGTGTNLHAAILGDFAQLLIGMWSGIDILVNPYALDTSGGTRITALQDCDVALRYPQAFAVCKEIAIA